jgi:hypothetical protein
MISEQDAASRKASLHPDLRPDLVPADYVKRWYFLNFASVEAALAFVNAPPAQVAGEISGNARNDGTVGMFYFL